MATRKATWLTHTSRMCPVMLACEGTLLKNGRATCVPCELAEKKKAQSKNKLRGERHMEYEDSRKKSSHDTRRP